MQIIQHWKLPDKFINEAYLYSSTCTSYDINNSLLQNTNQTSCWFINKPGGTVIVGMNLLFSNGQTASVAADGSISVYRPTFSDFHNDGNGFTWSTPSLIGLMEWDVTLNSKYDGLFGITQLINSDNANSDYYTGGYDLLDGDTEIYGTPNYNGPSTYTASDPSTHNITFLDTPSDIAAPCANMVANFKDFLRFQPSGSGSIYVTIATNGWYMNGNACLLGGISPDDLPPASAPVDNDTFPTWTGVRHGGGN